MNSYKSNACDMSLWERCIWVLDSVASLIIIYFVSELFYLNG